MMSVAGASRMVMEPIMGLMLGGLLIAALIGLGYLVFKTKAGKYIAALLLLGLVVAAIGAPFLSRVVQYRTARPAVNTYAVPARPVYPSGVQQLPPSSGRGTTAGISEVLQVYDTTPWSQGAGEAFLADVYPSKATAAVGLTRHFGQTIAKCYKFHLTESAAASQPSSNSSPRDVTIVGSRSLPRAALARAAEAMEGIDGVGNVTVTAYPGPDATDNSAIIKLSFLDDASILGVLNLHGKNTRKTVRFVNKMWLDDIASYRQQRPGRNLTVVASDRAFTNDFNARTRAIELAALKVAYMLRQQSPDLEQSAQSRGEFNTDWLESRIVSAMQSVGNNQIIVAMFSQRFSRSYGDVYQCWVLVDASSDKLQRLAANIRANRSGAIAAIRHEKKIWRRTWASWIGSVIGIVVLIILTYLLLNAATKGYYDKRLKVTLIVIGVVVLAALLLVVA